MALGFSLIFGAAVCGLVVVLGLSWIIRSLRSGEFGLFNTGMEPAIRRRREPVKFWLAITILAVLLLLPVQSVIFVVRQVLS